MRVATAAKLAPFALAVNLLFALGSQQASATTVTTTIGAGKVATIFENQPDNSIGRGPAVFVGGDASGSPRRGLIDFNIAANIPADAIITGVDLTMYLARVAGNGTASADNTARVIELHRITNDWAHGPTAINTTVIDGTDQGFPAIPPSPTWDERRYQQNQPWTTPGGDFAAAVSSSALVGETTNVAYTWESTAALVADVQGWLDDPSSNQGWMLINSDEWDLLTYRVFYTKDWTDTAMRPLLTVTYELAATPLPGALWLMGSGVIALGSVARRRRNSQPA